MLPSSYCQNLTIFEGPDGGGKTTFARYYAEKTGARYVHFPAMANVGSGLARMYVEAMLPALLGYQKVVFDRSWLSEEPYGYAYRQGQDRLGPVTNRMLERLAMRCGAVVVKCLPQFYTVATTYNSRKGIEMLDSVSQLKDVYHCYTEMKSNLPIIDYNYEDQAPDDIFELLNTSRMYPHEIDVFSAGNIGGIYAIVGDEFGPHKNDDALYQWPFASFSDVGCSRWLTAQLEEAGVGESQLFWINSDNVFDLAQFGGFKRIFILGGKAKERMAELGELPGDKYTVVDHPQYHKRFKSASPYPLINLLTSEFSSNYEIIFN